jgi:glycosyltransferase involved in cell wall biosynthesis
MSMCTLLMITHDRLAYTQKSLSRLIESEGDFALWLWDNGSTDGTADLVVSYEAHPRVERIRLEAENVGQNIPFQWLVSESRSPIVGKVDDDCLMPRRWIDPIADAITTHPDLGALGCWTFWPEDFDEKVGDHKIRTFGRHRILTNISIGGTGILIRRDLCQAFLLPTTFAIPIDQSRMAAAGLVNGWYYPLIWAEHMDDPRSKHCMLDFSDTVTATYALTARRLGHGTASDYLNWIRSDCDRMLREPTERQIRRWRTAQTKKRIRRKARSAMNTLRRLWVGNNPTASMEDATT